MDRTPKPGEVYRHFKDKMYQVVCLAHHSETDEVLVVYQALYGEFKICARPLEMFVSEVDHEKYPEVAQKYRFEKISVNEQCKEPVLNSTINREGVVAEIPSQNDATGSFNDISDKLAKFFDTNTYGEKLMVLESMKNYMSKELVESIAVLLDLNIEPGTIEEQFEQLEYGLKTMIRFENTRPR